MYKREMILIIDSSAKNRFLLAGMLSDLYEVVGASGIREAVTLLNVYSPWISLIFLHPGIADAGEESWVDFFTVMRQKSWVDIMPVIIIRGAGTNGAVVRQAYCLGAAESVSQPYEEAVVKQRIKNVLALYSHKNPLQSSLSGKDMGYIEQSRALFHLRQKIACQDGKIKAGGFHPPPATST